MYPNIKLLITDLDNTLYDWVTYFSASFYTMVEEVGKQLNISPEVLLPEFQKVHRFYEDTEQPFSITEVETILRRFPGKSATEIVRELDDSLHAFNRKRKETLKLYDGVAETLAELKNRNVTLIAHTESTVHNAIFRLEKLEIKHFFKHLYSLEGKHKRHPIEERNKDFSDDSFVIAVPKEDRKPNPRLILDICKIEGVHPSEVAYVGDSITRDISMAKEAGILSIWAKYGKSYSPDSWQKLVKISHWTNEDIERETYLRDRYSSIQPDLIINSFSELLTIIR